MFLQNLKLYFCRHMLYKHFIAKDWVIVPITGAVNYLIYIFFKLNTCSLLNLNFKKSIIPIYMMHTLSII